MTASIAFHPTLVLGLLLIAISALFVLVVHLSRKLNRFMQGKNAGSLESTLEWLTEKSARTDDSLALHKEGLEMIDNRLRRSLRGYSLVRYNAYDDAGGAQSFAIGLLDEHHDGVVLSIITNRHHVGMYAKKINRGTPDTTLTKEESDALDEAKKMTL